jgi:RNA polymerase sigma-70 factor (ECF subfamily)
LQANDAALAARVACGDAGALAPLCQRHRGPVYRFALLWSGSASIAPDLTQDAFLHLLVNAGNYDPVSSCAGAAATTMHPARMCASR